MQKKVALIGDVHGTIKEFLELLSKLNHESLDEIWHVGDLLDRGPDSGAVVQVCVERGIKGVLGNHESSVLARRESILKGNVPKKYTEKDRTINSIRPQDWSYLESLPLLHIFDDINTVIVHGGLVNKIPLYKQPFGVCHLQMIQPFAMDGRTRWWGYDAVREKSEEESRSEGWVRWYECYDHEQIVAYGHSVYEKPFEYGNTIGIDTGCVFGGELTALILPEKKYLSVKSKKTYFSRLNAHKDEIETSKI